MISYGTATNINVFKGKYLYRLKYDPFNGGEMVEKMNINMLKDSLFQDL